MLKTAIAAAILLAAGVNFASAQGIDVRVGRDRHDGFGRGVVHEDIVVAPPIIAIDPLAPTERCHMVVTTVIGNNGLPYQRRVRRCYEE